MLTCRMPSVYRKRAQMGKEKGREGGKEGGWETEKHISLFIQGTKCKLSF